MHTHIYIYYIYCICIIYDSCVYVTCLSDEKTFQLEDAESGPAQIRPIRRCIAVEPQEGGYSFSAPSKSGQ